jgi:hypothetical protein
MRKQQKKGRGDAPPAADNRVAIPRFEHPKVLAIDLPSTAVQAVRDGGFNVSEGSFGTPMRGAKSANYFHVPINGILPNVTEAEVVIADLAGPEVQEGLDLGDEPIGRGIWQQMPDGVIDPRPRLIVAAREYFGRSYSHGGAFILFADPNYRPGYEMVEQGMFGYGDKLPWSNWSLLDVLENGLDVTPDWGNEIRVVDTSLSAIVAALEQKGSFTCVIEPRGYVEERWATLATNKYGKPVAGALLPEKESGEGIVFIFPQVRDKGGLVRALLEDVLPRLTPTLFPEDERAAWVEDDAYAPTDIADLRAQIAAVREAAEGEVKELEEQMEHLREKTAHLRDILTATGMPLVTAVKKTVESLGFDHIRDVDEEEGVKDGRLHEDLQIDCDSPLLLVEVKGINGLPSDGEALEVQKYVLKRVRELDRTDVRGLTVINHQRGLPPGDRDPDCFQKEQVKNARDQEVGLLSAWNLYRLARGYQANGWRPEHVAPLFTEARGLVEPIPAHYRRIGTVVNFYEQAGAIAIELDETTELRQGERIALIDPVDYLEQDVESIEVNDEPVEVAPAGSGVGVKTAFSKQQIRAKMPVYRVEG